MAHDEHTREVDFPRAGEWLAEVDELRRGGGCVLVTGASGFVAGHVIKLLLSLGYVVRGTVRPRLDGSVPLERYAYLGELDGAKERLSLVETTLDSDEGWEEAMEGCFAVMHVASPCPAEDPDDEDELIVPAVQGTLRVLRAAQASGSVRRVVMTSSMSSIEEGHEDKSNAYVYSETDWSVDANLRPYGKSKLRAEQAAWRFVEEQLAAAGPDDRVIELVCICPSFVLGPVISGKRAASQEIVRRFLANDVPGLMKLSFNVVDVRDVAESHVRALERPAAAGYRFISSCDEVALWLSEFSAILAAEFEPLGYTIPKRVLPYCLIWLAARCDASIRMMLPDVGQQHRHNNQRAKDILGMEFRDPRETIIRMGYTLIEYGIVEDKRRNAKPTTGLVSGKDKKAAY